jgi:ABC-type Fe3+-hydroxamate transport system substrate-binding protein
MEDYADTIVGIVKALSDDSFEMIYSESSYEEIQKWIKDYNQYVRSYGSRLEKVETGTTVSYKMSSAMKNSYRTKIQTLTELMDALSWEIDVSRGSTPYFKEQLDRYKSYFDDSRQHMETVVENVL